MEENKKPLNEQESADDYEALVVNLVDEEGKEYPFTVIEEIEYNGALYRALVPYAENEEDLLEEDLDLVIMKVGQDEEGEYYDLVEDEEEYCQVSEIFEHKLEADYNIEQ